MKHFDILGVRRTESHYVWHALEPRATWIEPCKHNRYKFWVSWTLRKTQYFNDWLTSYFFNIVVRSADVAGNVGAYAVADDVHLVEVGVALLLKRIFSYSLEKFSGF